VQRALDPCPVVVTELSDIVRNVLEVRGHDCAVREQDLTARNACFRLPTQVENNLQKLRRVGALVQRTREVGGQSAREKLDLLVPVSGAPRGSTVHPKEGTRPFSRTGTLTASSLTKRSCVSSTLNPRPRRASIMFES